MTPAEREQFTDALFDVLSLSGKARTLDDLRGGGLAGGLRFQYYPTLLSGPVTPLTVSFFAVYGLLCFTPVLLDALSRRRYLVRKGGTPRA